MVQNIILLKLQEINVTLNQKEINTLLSAFSVHHLKKGDFFQEQGHLCDTIGFLIYGSLYSYSFNEDGSKKIHNLYYPSEKFIVFNYNSFYEKKPSAVYIECYEPCFFYAITRTKIRTLAKEIPLFHKIEEEILKINFKSAVQKSEILQNDSNLAKIKILQQYYTKVFSFFPYSYIASYLGIHRNTFNRIFKQI